jgi:hypothetical protein
MMTTSTKGMSKAAVLDDSSTLWLLAALACVGWGLWLGLLPRGARDRFRAARAELRLLRTRKRLRTAEAELMEADEYLAATGELLECYQEEFGALPVNPFAAADAGALPLEEWPEQLSEVGLRED